MQSDTLKRNPVEITEKTFDKNLVKRHGMSWHTANTTESYFVVSKNICTMYVRVFNRFFKLYTTKRMQHAEIVSQIMSAVRF